MLRFTLIVLFFASTLGGYAGGLRALFSYSSFNSPQSGPYVETYLSVIGSSVEYEKMENGTFQGSIEITIMFRNGEEVANFKKYTLLSPELPDTVNSFVNFIDQQRFSLPNGNYEMEIEIADLNSKEASFKSIQPFEINYSASEIKVSDVELVESFKRSEQESLITKSGYDIIPYVSSFYPERMKKIGFYAEVYNTGKVLGDEEKFLVNYYIEAYETGVVLSKYKRFQRYNASDVNVVLGEFDITALPSGNYQLAIEVRDRNNELKSINKVFFQRSNPAVQLDATDIAAIEDLGFVANITGEDTLDLYIKSIYPISSQLERNFVRSQLQKPGNLELKQKYFISFWQTRDKLNPEQAWRDYQVEIKKVSEIYKSPISHGFETDRGRVYLQYGAPNTIIERKNEPNTYPYEIWHYYKAGQRSNIKFVFYNRENASNMYELLHSDAYGEVMNYRWKVMIQKRTEPGTNPDQTDPQDSYGTRVDDYFDNPR